MLTVSLYTQTQTAFVITEYFQNQFSSGDPFPYLGLSLAGTIGADISEGLSRIAKVVLACQGKYTQVPFIANDYQSE